MQKSHCSLYCNLKYFVAVVCNAAHVYGICSLTDVALCTKGWRLASNAEIQQVLKQRHHDCLLLDAIERYHSAVQLTSPTASTQKSRVIVSKFAVGTVHFV